MKRRIILGLILAVLSVLLYLFFTFIIEQKMSTPLYFGICAVMIIVRLMEVKE